MPANGIREGWCRIALQYPDNGIRVQAALAYRLDDPGQRGKHVALDQDRAQQIFDWIQQNAEKDTPTMR
jgi:hypothetical protein